MPLYDFECPVCHATVEVFRHVAQAKDPMACECGAAMCWRPPAFIARTFTPHYDEGAGRDFYSAREKREWLRENGLIEAGDAVNGARNFDASAPHHVGRSAPRGVRPQTSKAEIEDRQNEMEIQTVTRDGKVVDRKKWGELEGLENVRWHRT